MIAPQSRLANWSSVTLSADRTTSAFDAGSSNGFVIFAKWGAGAVGTMKIQSSNDAVDSAGSVTNWDDIPGSTVTVNGAGQQTWTWSGAKLKWVRIYFTYTSGTATVTDTTVFMTNV
ncbi:MAG: hypothetical protein AB7I27_00315 [Bacteriovoracaceae bacterium]